MANAREFASLFYTDKVAQRTDSFHLVDYYQKIVAAAGASVQSFDFNLQAAAEAVEAGAALLTQKHIDPANYAVFVPSSAHASKCWSTQCFAQLAERIHSQFGFEIIAVGTESEKPVTKKLCAEANVTIADFAGLTDIAKLIALLKGARLVVSNDTGPGQIAAALGIPAVLIFGRTNPVRVGPYARKDSVAAVDADKRSNEINSPDPGHAIEFVTVDMVFEKILCQLKTS